MSTLHDRLADLAADADARAGARAGARLDGPAAVDGLWDRGRRYHRLRRGGTAAIVVTAVAVLAGVLGSAELRATPSPAPAGSRVGVPERIFAPSPFLEGTDDGGPLGRLAALVPAERSGLWGSDQGYVGVSAETGEYRFLDLPDAASSSRVVLSPDGTRVAYWATGPTDDTPNTNGGESPVTDVAVYDPATGDVARAGISTEHGLTDDTLDWADEDTLLIAYGQYVGGDDDSQMEQSSGRHAPTLLWDVAQAEPRPATLRTIRGGMWWGRLGASGHVVVEGTDEGRFSVVAVDDEVLTSYRHEQNLSAAITAGPRGEWVAAVWGGPGDNGRNPNRLVGGRLPATSGSAPTPVDLERVPGSRRYRAVVGWLDAHTVLALGSRGGYEGRTGIDAVDLRDGTTEELVTAPPMHEIGEWQVATALLAEPTVEAVEPPSPADPRRTAGFAGLTVVGALGALVLWRRRVRP